MYLISISSGSTPAIDANAPSAIAAPNSVTRRKVVPDRSAQLAACQTLGVPRLRSAHFRQMSRIQQVRPRYARHVQRSIDRLEELFAVLLHQRFEERHAQHLPFPFVNARGEKLVDVVAEEVTVQKRPPHVT